FVLVGVVVALRADSWLVRSTFVRIEQCAAFVEPQPLVGRPARPFGTHQRVRSTPIDQSTAERVLTRSRQPDRTTQTAARRDLGEWIAQATHATRCCVHSNRPTGQT